MSDRDQIPIRIASAVPGRIRLQWTGGQDRSGSLSDLSARLSGLAGVRDARVVADAKSLIVRYAVAERALGDVVHDITTTAARMQTTGRIRPPRPHRENVSLSAVPEYTASDPEAPVRGAAALRSSSADNARELKALLLSTAAVLAAATEALPAALVGGTLALAALPIARRAAAELRHRRIRMDQLDLVNLMVLVSIGDLLTAGQITWVISLGDFLRCKKIRHVRRKVSELMLLEYIRKDPEALRVVRMIESAPVANAHIEHEITRAGDRLALPLLAAACAAYLLTRDPLRGIAVLRFADLASDVRIAAPATFLTAMTAAARQGIFIRGGRAMEKLAQVDAIVFERTEALPRGAPFSAVLAALLDRGVRCIAIPPGDHARAARAVAAQRGLRGVVSEVSANRQAALAQRLRDQGYRVAVIGDGLDGSPCFTPADVGVHVAHGGAGAKKPVDVTLLDGDLGSLPRAVDVAREAIGILKQNKRLVAGPTAGGLLGSILGLSPPLVTTLIVQGAAALAGLNALRPLLQPWHPDPRQRIAGRLQQRSERRDGVSR